MPIPEAIQIHVMKTAPEEVAEAKEDVEEAAEEVAEATEELEADSTPTQTTERKGISKS